VLACLRDDEATAGQSGACLLVRRQVGGGLDDGAHLLAQLRVGGGADNGTR
jgi:hypothetical protein